MSQTRKPRTTITVETVKQARNLMGKGKTDKEIGEIIGISYDASRKLCSRIANNLSDEVICKKKGRKPANNSEVRSVIASGLMRDNSLTQLGMVDILAERSMSRTQSFVSKVLKKMEYSRKRLMKIPAERNSPATINARQLYAREIQHISPSNLVYLDETGFNLHISQNYGYSPKNEKAYVMVPANKGQNISLMAVISISGLVCYEMKDGAYDGASFISFINNHLVPYFSTRRDHVLVMDNCRFHHRQDVLAVLTDKGISYKFLPPYSPQLNPIEEFFGELKANYRAIKPLSKTREQIKTQVQGLLNARTGSFENGYNKAHETLQTALARNPFL